MNKPNQNLETIAEIKEILIKQKLWLAVAESLTCGKLQSSIGEVSGVSQCFKGGITAYSIDEKVKFLNVNHAEAEKVNCVSQNIATQMAIGICKMFDSEIGIATTGYAERFVDEAGTKIEPHAFYTVVLKDSSNAFAIIIEGKVWPHGRNRQEFQDYIVSTIFEKLLTHIKAQPSLSK